MRVTPPKITKNMHELAAWAQNKLVVGLDEVGRGCLAGPLVTAAVMLPQGKAHRQLKDSKVMSPEERAVAYRWIVKNCHFGVGIIHHRIIDEQNIWQANLIAMQKALVTLMAIAPARPIAILSDAVPLKLLDTAFKDIPVHSFPKGEKYSSSIAAASIVAKVTRDAMMERLDYAFPGYKLGQHKGYSTAIHQNAVRASGPSIIHRMSFLSNILQAQATEVQSSLFSPVRSDYVYPGLQARQTTPDKPEFACPSKLEERNREGHSENIFHSVRPEALEGHFKKNPNIKESL